MIEFGSDVIPGQLFVGSLKDCYELLSHEDVIANEDWAILHAAKEPFHRGYLGYKGRGAPKDNPEYLWAYRVYDRQLALNLIDATDPKYIPVELIDEAIKFLGNQIDKGRKVLVHCNQGLSRAPSIAALYVGAVECGDTLANTLAHMTTQYPDYRPGAGMQKFMIANWERYGGEVRKSKKRGKR